MFRRVCHHQEVLPCLLSYMRIEWLIRLSVMRIERVIKLCVITQSLINRSIRI
jgi:hypothetical protein